MGLLLEERYWARVSNLVFDLRPMPGDPLIREDAVKLLETACKALSDLIIDADLEADIEKCLEIAEAADKAVPKLPGEFLDFTNAFKKAETEVLIHSGVDMDATVAICDELSDILMAERNPEDYRRLPDKILSAQTLICEKAKDPDYRNDPHMSLIDDVRDGTLGLGAVGMDCAIMLKTGTVGDALIGQSVSVGFGKFKQIWTRRW